MAWGLARSEVLPAQDAEIQFQILNLDGRNHAFGGNYCDGIDVAESVDVYDASQPQMNTECFKYDDGGLRVGCD